MLHAVVFDLDDTLIDWSKHDADWMNLRREHLRPVVEHLTQDGHSLPPLDHVVMTYAEINREAWEASSPPDWIAPRQLDVLRQTLVTLKVDVKKLDMERLQKLFAWGLMPDVQLFPDTVDVLRMLRAESIKVGLITNASSPMWMRDRELQALGLLDYFDVRFTAGDIGHLKPHPRAFEAVLDALKVTPSGAVFVGDRQHDDVTGAQSVGMKAVWVQRGTEEPSDDVQPDAVINQLSELPSLLDEWYPRWRNNSKGG